MAGERFVKLLVAYEEPSGADELEGIVDTNKKKVRCQSQQRKAPRPETSLVGVPYVPGLITVAGGPETQTGVTPLPTQADFP